MPTENLTIKISKNGSREVIRSLEANAKKAKRVNDILMRVGKDATVTLPAGIRGNLTAELNPLIGRFAKLGSQTKSLNALTKMLGKTLKGIDLMGLGEGAIELADRWGDVTAKLQEVTSNTVELERVSNSLLKVAVQTTTPLDRTVHLHMLPP